MNSPAHGEEALAFDVIVVGAGISGIAAGHYLQERCPDRTYAILESRQAIGGTWDLFRYPGVRSDSDMFTLGYSFRPWDSNASFARGAAIRDYVAGTARDEGIDQHIRFGHCVKAAHWNSQDARWLIEVEASGGASLRITCRFLFFCSGYYDYGHGHEPDWPGRDTFKGTIVHPQHWPQGLDHAGRNVVVIGSGATAITLVPELAAAANHVTMLQRSPSYIIALPSNDPIDAALRRRLPRRVSHSLIRWKNILLGNLFFQYCRRWPQRARRLLRRAAKHQLGEGFDIERHLAPAYDPWDQRLCIAPDGDIFSAVRSGKASIVTDTIERFTPDGILLASGQEIAADIIVTATGLKLKMLGGTRISVDGQAVDLSQSMIYRGTMYSGLPNLAVAMGYTNATWTLKCELSARYVCRLLNHMRANGFDNCVPVADARSMESTQPFLNLTSGYIQRAAAMLPRQGTRKPWRMYQNYLLDLLNLRFSRLGDSALQFGRRRG